MDGCGHTGLLCSNDMIIRAALDGHVLHRPYGSLHLSLPDSLRQLPSVTEPALLLSF